VDTASCPHCDAPIKPTATFCLACDRPIVDTERGLSVAETTAAPARPRPVLVGVVIAGVLALLGGSTYAVVHYIAGRHHHAEAVAGADARKAVTLLVRAEAGSAHACRRVAPLLSGSSARRDCQDIVGRDPGVQFEDVHTGTATIDGSSATVRISARVTDGHGTRTIDDVLKLTQAGNLWQLDWNGTPPA
jgi:hypothetical protein